MERPVYGYGDVLPRHEGISEDKEMVMDDIYSVDMKLDSAIGTIEPGPGQTERLHEVVERLRTAEFYETVTERVPRKCIDGRTGGDGIAPNAPGGSEALIVADDLTVHHFAGEDGSTLTAYVNGLHYLKEKGLPVGGHTDAHAIRDASGCGANDRLGEIYGFMYTRGDIIRDAAAALGVTATDTMHETIMRNAHERTEFSPGGLLLQAAYDIGGNECVDPLHGDHKEVVAVINTVDGTTLDRDALEREFGSDYEAFNADVWSYPEAAAILSDDEDEIHEIVAAMTYYTLATAHVLCGPGMGVIVRK